MSSKPRHPSPSSKQNRSFTSPVGHADESRGLDGLNHHRICRTAIAGCGEPIIIPRDEPSRVHRCRLRRRRSRSRTHVPGPPVKVQSRKPHHARAHDAAASMLRRQPAPGVPLAALTTAPSTLPLHHILFAISLSLSVLVLIFGIWELRSHRAWECVRVCRGRRLACTFLLMMMLLCGVIDLGSAFWQGRRDDVAQVEMTLVKGSRRWRRYYYWCFKLGRRCMLVATKSHGRMMVTVMVVLASRVCKWAGQNRV